MARYVTKFGDVDDSGNLGSLDKSDFLYWVKNYKRSNPDLKLSSNEEWVILYKKTLAAEYAEMYFKLSERA